MDEKKNVVLNADQKAVVEKRSKDVFFAIQQLNKWVQSNSLTEDMREALPNLATNHLLAIKEAVGFTGEEPDHLKEMTRAMNQSLHDRIEELEMMLSNQNSLLTVKQQLNAINEKINKWWDEEGFNYIQDITFTGNGTIKVVFGFMLDSSSSLMFSKTPHSDKESLKAKIQSLVDQGFIFAKKDHGNDKDLIDCDQNRELLIKVVMSAFPSAKVISFRNHLFMDKGVDENNYILRDFEVYIYNYEDIENLG